MKYTFIKVHRPQVNVRAMCRMLRVHPSGFYAWLKQPFSKRAVEDKRQTELLNDAWMESGKVYGYRKLDLSRFNSAYGSGLSDFSFEVCR